MLAPAATAALTASEPEWSNVPSPMFWVKWSRSRNGAMPIHCIPSPPIWDTVQRHGGAVALHEAMGVDHRSTANGTATSQ
jgi:hypothetical protein